MKTTLSIRKFVEMREVMMDPYAPAPGELYYMIRSPGMNITVLPEYRLGQEYPKTYGHFHQPEVEETYTLLLGEAAVLLQKGVEPVETIELVKLSKGEPFTIPKNCAHSLINLGRGPVVTIDDHDPKKYINNYNSIRERRGFAYYIIEEAGEMQTALNPNYTKVPPLKTSG